MLEVEEMQQQWHLEFLEKQRVADQIKRHKEFLDCVRNQLGNDASLQDPILDDIDNAPDLVVYFRDDGEKNLNSTSLDSTSSDTSSDSEPIWKEFEIPLLDKNGEPCLDDEEESITIIVKDPK